MSLQGHALREGLIFFFLNIFILVFNVSCRTFTCCHPQKTYPIRQPLGVAFFCILRPQKKTIEKYYIQFSTAKVQKIIDNDKFKSIFPLFFAFFCRFICIIQKKAVILHPLLSKNVFSTPFHGVSKKLIRGFSKRRSTTRLLIKRSGNQPLRCCCDDERDVAQSGSATVWGTGGRKFKSCHPDKRKRGHSLFFCAKVILF